MPYHYELTPEESHHVRSRMVDETFVVFGKERMEKTIGHEADEEIAKAFSNTIQAICMELPEPEDQYFMGHPLGKYRVRALQRQDEPSLILHWNPEGNHGFAPTAIDVSPASASFLKAESKTVLKGRKGLRPGKYFIYEHMYVDRGSGKVKILKAIYSRTPLGTNESATKYATKEEVEEALNIISASVKHDDTSNG